MPPRKRKKAEEAEELCIVCSSHPAGVVQQECGHCVLCSTCGFRIFSEDRLCPSCRSAMLFPLVLKADVSTEPFSPAVETAALRFAEEAVTAAVGNAEGVLQSLKAVLPRIPAEALPRWFTAFKKTCRALKQDAAAAAASIVIGIGASCSEDVRHAAVEFLAKCEQGDDPTGSLLTFLVKNAQPVAAVEASGMLLRALEDHMQGTEIMKAACSKIEEGHGAAIASVVAAMRLFPGNRAIAEQGAAAIDSFCDDADEHHLSLAAAAGCAEALTQAMLAHPRSVAVQASGLEAASSIIESDAGATWVPRSAVAATGLAAVAALRAHAGDSSVVAAAVGAITTVTFYADTVEGAVAAGCVGVTLAAMQQYPQNPTVQRATCTTVGNVTYHLRADGITAAEARTGLALAVTALSAHADNLAVVASACSALEGIVVSSDHPLMGEHLLSVAPDIAADLVSALAAIEDGDDAGDVVRTLTHLSACPGGRDKVAAAGAATAAKAAAAKHAEHAKLQEAVAALEAALQAQQP